MTREEVEGIFRRYGPMVYRRARSLLGDPEEAKDVMQEVFIKAMDERNRFDGKSHVSTWLYRVTTNACLNHLRDSGRRKSLARRELGHRAEASDPGEHGLLARQILSEANELEGKAALYIHVDGMTYDEASEVLGVSKRTVSNLLERFRTFATQKLGESES
ncbi:MAG: sigma-70 family RNA polymerase sigma factor [Deltaproteobacteria bacterium]|nr:sigma-70 family RNA polymerase sigma factor [Deltaproteobacteria bacterium]